MHFDDNPALFRPARPLPRYSVPYNLRVPRPSVVLHQMARSVDIRKRKFEAQSPCGPKRKAGAGDGPLLLRAELPRGECRAALACLGSNRETASDGLAGHQHITYELKQREEEGKIQSSWEEDSLDAFTAAAG